MRCPEMDRFKDAHSFSAGQDAVPGAVLHFGLWVRAEARPKTWNTYVSIKRFFEIGIVNKLQIALRSEVKGKLTTSLPIYTIELRDQKFNCSGHSVRVPHLPY